MTPVNIVQHHKAGGCCPSYVATINMHSHLFITHPNARLAPVQLSTHVREMHSGAYPSYWGERIHLQKLNLG